MADLGLIHSVVQHCNETSTGNISGEHVPLMGQAWDSRLLLSRQAQLSLLPIPDPETCLDLIAFGNLPSRRM